MKLFGYTCTFNEAKYIPYVMPFVENMGYDKFYVYDNGSSDNTVELLSKYDFIEIRHYDTNGTFNDKEKVKIQIEGYLECYRLSLEIKEDVFMTFTDFDEVIYEPDYTGSNFKEKLSTIIKYHNELNFLSKGMVNLLPPLKYKDVSLLPLLKNNKHLLNIEGLRCNIWDMGFKPLLIKVNDFPYIACYEGNHYMEVDIDSGKELHSIEEYMTIYAFHLKYIDKIILEDKTKSYAERGAYNNILNNIDKVYNNMNMAAFPLEMYFCMNGIEFQKNKQGIKIRKKI